MTETNTQVTDGPTAAETGAGAPAADDAPSRSDSLSAIYDALTSDAPEAGAEAQDVSDDQAPPTEERPASPAVPLPPGWSSEKADVFASLPEDARTYVASRMQEMNVRLTQLGRTAKEAEPVLGVLKEFPDTFESKGINAAEGVRRLLQAQELLDTDPIAGIEAIAASYGVNLATLANGSNEQITQMQRELAALRTEQRLREQRQQAHTIQTLEDRIAKWAENKEHYSDLEQDILATIPAIDRTGKTEEQILDEAYDKAVWANAKTRETLLAKQREAQEAEKAKMQRVRDAKKNRGLNAGATGLPFELNEKFDRRNIDHMSRLYDSLANR